MMTARHPLLAAAAPPLLLAPHRGKLLGTSAPPRWPHYALGRLLAALLVLTPRGAGAGTPAPWLSQFGCDDSHSCPAPLEPEARSKEEEVHRVDVESALGWFWDDLSGIGIPQAEEEEINRTATSQPPEGSTKAPRPATYGEITCTGVRQVGRALGIDSHSSAAEPVVFMDLGSGVGKLVAQAFLEWPAVVRAVGVELSATRASRAQAAWGAAVDSGEAARLRSAALALAGRADEGGSSYAANVQGLELLQGDLFAADVSQATHIYVASLCFSGDMLLRVARKLADEAPRLQTVVSLARFPKGIHGYRHERIIEAQMTWTMWMNRGASTHIYTRMDSASERHGDEL